MSLLDTIIDKKPPKILYHYTSPGGLFGIVTNKSLWATNLHYFNDSSEFSYAINLTNNILTNDAEWIDKHEFIEMIKRHLSSICKLQKFVVSLSENGDLLSQWRGYCPTTGGYSIGFDANKLSKIVSKDCAFYLYPCEYDIHIQKSLLNELLHDTYDNYLIFKQQFSDLQDVSESCHVRFISRFQVIAALIKDPSWSEEKEWRIASNPLPNTHPNFKIRVGKYNLIPYFELSLGKAPEEWAFKEVIVGPNPYQELAIDSASTLLSINKVEGWSLRCSKIPFRSC